jgi:hypothetical protein
LIKKSYVVLERRLMPIIPATQEAQIGRIKVQGWPGQKVRDPSQQTSWVWWFRPVIPDIWAALVGGLLSEPNLRQRDKTPTSKITKKQNKKNLIQ